MWINAAAAPNAGGGSTDVKGKKVTLLTVAQSCDYCAKHTEEFKKVAEAAGVQVTVVVNDFNAAEQAQQVTQAISTRPDAVVLWPADATAIMPSLQRLKQSKIPVVVTNSHPQSDDDSLWNTFTGPDDYANGQEAAKAMIAGFKEKGFGDSGSVVIVEGVPGTPPPSTAPKASRTNWQSWPLESPSPVHSRATGIRPRPHPQLPASSPSSGTRTFAASTPRQTTCSPAPSSRLTGPA